MTEPKCLCGWLDPARWLSDRCPLHWDAERNAPSPLPSPGRPSQPGG